MIGLNPFAPIYILPVVRYRKFKLTTATCRPPHSSARRAKTKKRYESNLTYLLYLSLFFYHSQHYIFFNFPSYFALNLDDAEDGNLIRVNASEDDEIENGAIEIMVYWHVGLNNYVIKQG